MPGPGPHMMYAMGVGVSLTWLSDGAFGPHHTLVYVINAFLGPDIGSFSEWLGSTVFGSEAGSALADFVHHPFTYVLALAVPLCFLYSGLSRFFLNNSLLFSASGVPLSKTQCLLLISAGSLSHFFLDHLFEENGHTRMYTWILSTGWWKNRAPINTDAVIIIGFLCTLLIVGFVYINRVEASINDAKQRVKQTTKLLAIVACLYGVWCSSQIYWVNPRRPAIGEEADLGVLVFLWVYFFFPHYLCILSMNPKDIEPQQIPR